MSHPTSVFMRLAPDSIQASARRFGYLHSAGESISPGNSREGAGALLCGSGETGNMTGLICDMCSDGILIA